MSAEKRNITIEKGAVLVEIFELLDDAGAPVDVSGYTARLQIRADFEDEDPALELDQTGGITVGGEDGRFTVRATATETAALELETGFYDLEILPAGEEADAIRLAQGVVYVAPNVTRPAIP